MTRIRRIWTIAGILLMVSPAVMAQTAGDGDAANLAKKLSNPVADLISVPFQFNYNGGFYDGNGDQYYQNIQPVIPI
jgi:hypothetical protein